MAFVANQLAPVFYGGAGKATHYVYVTTDSISTVSASGYFSSTVTGGVSSANGSPLSIGDIIEIIFVDAISLASRTATTGRVYLQVATNNGTTVTTQQAQASGTAAVVDTTATTLAITRALHHEKEITVSSAAPIAITLPQATGTGSRYRFKLLVAATATQHTIKVANATDVMTGSCIGILSTTALGTPGFNTSATSDTITLNGTTTGGAGSDQIEIVDVATGKFTVNMRASVVATALSLFLTPFSATV